MLRPFLLALLLGILPLSAAAADPVFIAHRGRDATTPENTLTAFRHSIERGITVLETDVRQTKDGELVLLHDATVDRTTNGHGRIGDLTLAQAKALDAGSGEHIPTLREALRLVRSTRASLLLDMKPGTPLEPVIALVRAEATTDHVIFGLRSPSQAKQLRSNAPEMRIVALMPKLKDFDAFEAAGVRTMRLWSNWIDPEFGGDPAVVGKVKARGHAVWCVIGKRLPASDAGWRATHERLGALGVDAITTDRPDLATPTAR